VERGKVDTASVVSRVVLAGGAAPAVVAPDRLLTYAELDAASNEVADRLRTEGVAAGDLVGLKAPRSIELVVGALGIVKTGAAYMPLDPTYPEERLAFMLADSGTRFVLDEALVLAERPAAANDRARIGQQVQPETAYVIYTSGSTGRPKGVMVPHRGLASLVDWHLNAFGVGSGDRCSLIASTGFDASVWEIWPCLAGGATLCIPDDDTRRDPKALQRWMLAEGVTVSFVPTGLAERLLRLEWPADARLRVLLTGGDALMTRPSPALPFTLVNNYGVTEASVVSTSGPVPPTGEPGVLPSIGAAIAGAHLYVVDEDLAPVPAGETGELLIGGPSVALGYLNDEERTAARFIADHLTPPVLGPSTPEAAARLFRTGDRVRVDTKGNFEFLGRMDDQVKVRGFRVECGEVAATLLENRGVSQCVVVATDARQAAGATTGADRRLLAYLVAADAANIPSETELRTHLTAWLPDYMMPDSFVWLDEMPLSDNGKIDRDALVAPVPVARPLEADELPATPLEEEIAGFIAELLELPQVGAEEDFFLLGGHSLLAAQLIAGLSDAFGVEVALKAVFEGPTVRMLAAEVERLVVAQLSKMSDEEAVQELSLSFEPS
jgi:amino acid adenylation domain-containing protein